MTFVQVADAVEIPSHQRTNDACGNPHCGVTNLSQRLVVVQRAGVSFCSFPCAGVAYAMPFGGYLPLRETQSPS